jgi:hypothetical protein
LLAFVHDALPRCALIGVEGDGCVRIHCQVKKERSCYFALFLGSLH